MKELKALYIIIGICCILWRPKAEAAEVPMENTNLVAAVLILEAGGEIDSRAMPAVMEVIRNRQKKRKGWTMEQVVTQPFQFSCLNHVAPERAIKLAQQHPKWQVALLTVTGKPTSYVGKCDHYFAPSKVTPFWYGSVAERRTIGNHMFVRLAPKIKLITKHPGSK